MTIQTSSIEEQAQAFVTGSAAAMPAEILSAFAAEQVSLDAAGVPTGVSAPGTPMPDADLLDVHGARPDQPRRPVSERPGRDPPV